MDKQDSVWDSFSDLNLGYIADMFERYSADPESLDPVTRAFFDRHGPPSSGASPAEIPALTGITQPPAAAPLCEAIALSTAIRTYGYRAAHLDPLGKTPPGDLALRPETYGIRESDLVELPASVVGGPVSEQADNALEAVRALRAVYEGTSGFEFEHVSNAEERGWLRYAVESGSFRPPRQPINERTLLEQLTLVEGFERFLHTAFPTQTRFSIQGLDMLVPMLEDIVGAAAEEGTRVVTLGMAHRGRLNVLAHVLGKPYEQIIAEFQGSAQRPNVSASGSGGAGWTGDVKYHLAARKAVEGGREVEMVVSLLPNPSHLEFIAPVVEGVTRAGSERRDDPGPAKLDEMAALAVLVHGEAAFVGEGIAGETLNLSRLPGYRTGGTIHIIANNQVGFTTPPELGRSTLFASDLAKGFEIPIVHVNADDPEACIAAVRLAHAYVDRFRKDVMVDLIGYRRWGHNEGDEPTFTEPVMYRAIAGHRSVRELWAQDLERRGRGSTSDAERLLREITERLYEIRRALPKDRVASGDEDEAGLEAGGVHGGLGHSGVAPEIETTVAADVLARLNEEILVVPDDFRLHSKLQPFYARRRANLADEKGAIDWAHAEALAFASILVDGTPIRLTGQDTARGTFGQRHLVLHDVETGVAHIPLQNIPSARAAFEVWDSPLSEQATMGFEFGYNIQAPEALVLWEAQYGDFVNAAQVIVDEFIVSARPKWGLRPSLVLLLPHGYEGQGPDHSSARMERFLHMAAQDNLRIANCTNATQYFHILRRQARLLNSDPRPLVLLTPKSLLRHPMASSTLRDLSQGKFHPVIDDVEARRTPDEVRRLVLCTGRVFVDLVAARAKDTGEAAHQVAIVRLEELYPFPASEIDSLIAGYAKIEEVVWVQEEPRNMGGWTYVAPRLRDILEDRRPLIYVGRTRRASPAEGSHEWYQREQARLVEDALVQPRARARHQP